MSPSRVDVVLLHCKAQKISQRTTKVMLNLNFYKLLKKGEETETKKFFINMQMPDFKTLSSYLKPFI